MLPWPRGAPAAGLAREGALGGTPGTHGAQGVPTRVPSSRSLLGLQVSGAVTSRPACTEAGQGGDRALQAPRPSCLRSPRAGHPPTQPRVDASGGSLAWAGPSAPRLCHPLIATAGSLI